jgi:hypothetical protein
MKEKEKEKEEKKEEKEKKGAQEKQEKKLESPRGPAALSPVRPSFLRVAAVAHSRSQNYRHKHNHKHRYNYRHRHSHRHMRLWSEWRQEGAKIREMIQTALQFAAKVTYFLCSSFSAFPLPFCVDSLCDSEATTGSGTERREGRGPARPQVRCAAEQIRSAARLSVSLFLFFLALSPLSLCQYMSILLSNFCS